MPQKKNPAKLNPLQLRTLTLLQVLATIDEACTPQENGEVTITAFPDPHGDHFHLGDAVVAASDASGLNNEAVWNALARKNMARSGWPASITLTVEGLQYDTGLREEILHTHHHH